MILAEQILLIMVAGYFAFSTVACVALYEIRSGKVTAQELNTTEDKIQEIKDLDRICYLIMFLFWGVIVFTSEKGE